MRRVFVELTGIFAPLAPVWFYLWLQRNRPGKGNAEIRLAKIKELLELLVGIFLLLAGIFLLIHFGYAHACASCLRT